MYDYEQHQSSNNLLIRHNEFFILLTFDMELHASYVEVPTLDIVQLKFEMVIRMFDMVLLVFDMVLSVFDLVHNIRDWRTKFVDTYIGFHEQLVD